MLDVEETAQRLRTRTEMEVSVLNDIHFPTHASKYWQAVREQSGMFENITLLSFKYKKSKIKLKILRERALSEKDALQKELKQARIEEKEYELRCMRLRASAIIRELMDWSEIKANEIIKMSLDEIENVNNHQLISYTVRWIKQSCNMGNAATPGEINNLVGQLNSGLRLCIKRGVFEEVMSRIDNKIAEKIKLDYGIK
jgi:hypothetical protein